MDRNALLPFGGRRSPSSLLGRSGNPFMALHDEMNRLFDEVSRGFGMPAVAGDGNGGMMAPQIDIKESDKEIELCADLPGVDQKDIQIEIQDDLLTLRGERKAEHEDKQESYRLMERSYGSFARSIRLPFAVDPEKAQARFKDGVLTVTLPKPPEAAQKTRRVEVKPG